MNPKFIDVMVVRKTSFRSCFKLETRSTILLYDHIMHAFDHLSIYATKTRTKIAYEHKAKRKLTQTKLKFSNEQNHKRKVTAKQLFELFYFFANRNK